MCRKSVMTKRLSGVIVLGLMVMSTASVNGTTPFFIETVDTTGSVGRWTSIALSATRTPHIAYTGGPNGNVIYAVRNGANWATEIVDTVGWQYTSLALDGNGNPHITYFDEFNSDLKYAIKTDGDWYTETIDAAGFIGRWTSLAIDVQGTPHVSYLDETNHDLKYAVKTGGTWSTETVDAAGWVGFHSSLALDAQGKPHVSYLDQTNDDLKYASKIGGIWVTETVDEVYTVGENSSLEIDTQGDPHVSYYNLTNGDLKYAVKRGGIWSTEVVDSTGDVGRYTSISLDAAGNPHISYTDLENHDLKYAVKIGGVWSTETVDVPGDVGWYTSLALDKQGSPHVSYYDFTNRDLKYAHAAIHLTSPVGGERWYRGTQATVTWDGVGEVDIFVSADGGANYSPLLSNVSGGNAEVGVPAWTTEEARVKVVRDDPYSTSESPGVFTICARRVNPWWLTIVTEWGFANSPSLAVDGAGHPHIAYDEGGLLYAVKTGEDWTVDTVDASGWWSSHSSLALDAQGVPHISYYVDSYDLKYAVKSGGTWTLEKVDSTGSVGQYNSLALDSQGNPHISYYDETNLDLKYAVKTAGGWTLQTLLGGGDDLGRYTSLALDNEDRPHIIYYDNTNGNLNYVWYTDYWWGGGGTVAATTIGGNQTSLGLNEEGIPHITWVTNGDVNYAIKTGSSWVLETVDTKSAWDASLAVDAQGNPHIGVGHPDGTVTYAVKMGDDWMVEMATDVPQVDNVTFVSLALDAQGNPHIGYTTYDDGGFLKYASAAIEVAEPSGGTKWPVGATRRVSWDGTGEVDVWLSVDGGASYPYLLASGASGGQLDIVVPHAPSRFCIVKVERREEANTYGSWYYPQSIATSDSFFTIETAIELLAMMTSPAPNGPGLVVTWSTDPGPDDLEGYRLEKRRGDTEWLTLVSKTKETRYHDREGESGDSYRLFAINGLGEELYLGETADGRTPALPEGLVAYPVPYRGGDLTIDFATGSVGGATLETEVVIYDVLGRKVKTVAKGRFTNPAHRALWDGRDESGNEVASGIYFIRANTGLSSHVRKLVIVR